MVAWASRSGLGVSSAPCVRGGQGRGLPELCDPCSTFQSFHLQKLPVFIVFFCLFQMW